MGHEEFEAIFCSGDVTVSAYGVADDDARRLLDTRIEWTVIDGAIAYRA